MGGNGDCEVGDEEGGLLFMLILGGCLTFTICHVHIY